MKRKFQVFIVVFLLLYSAAKSQTGKNEYNEIHRPQFHFSPKANWMNDPNGMVYHTGVYHLFFQHYPDSTVWGPMHWGHATTKDLVHWEEQPIALFPDSLGYIFSGSAVVDSLNTSGFGTNDKPPLVAIFTHHDPKGEKQGKDNFQNQSLAYSLDDGRTWTKYKGNPVLKNPGIKDYRDPKVMWYAPSKKWIMTLATKDRITFYSSPDLKNWKKESEFGKDVGAHGGVWECPDLFPLPVNGETVWVLFVSINPGGPNGGSATQYFTGNFDGSTFTPRSTETKWVDYGPDDYAGVTWSNTGNRKIFLGWMSNWQYANLVPTDTWRNAMTVPRDLALKTVANNIFLTSQPVRELQKIISPALSFENIRVKGEYDLSPKVKNSNGLYQLKIRSADLADFSIVLSNTLGEELVVGFDRQANQYYIDRSKSGKKDFEKDFAKKHTAPRLTENENIELTLLADAASIELFADEGLTVMTEIFFPNKPLSQIRIKSSEDITLKTINYADIKSAWNSTAMVK